MTMSLSTDIKVTITILVIDDSKLEDTLASLRSQTLKEVEFLCILGNGIECADDYDERYRFIKSDAIGTGELKDIAISEAKGEVIIFITAGDIATDKLAEAAYFYIDRFRLDIFVFGYSLDGVPIKPLVKNGVYCLKEAPDVLALSESSFLGKAFRKVFLERCGLSFAKLGRQEDVAVWPILVHKAGKIGYEYRELIEHKPSLAITLDSLYGYIEAVDYYLNYYMDNGFFTTYHDPLEHHTTKVFICALKELLYIRDKDLGDRYINEVFRSKGYWFKRRAKTYPFTRSEQIYLHKTIYRTYYHHYIKSR